jgi:hypothetical protein
MNKFELKKLKYEKPKFEQNSDLFKFKLIQKLNKF